MFRPLPMNISDYTCLFCGIKLKLALASVVVGDNFGNCPMCNEPYKINITVQEMEEFIKLENDAS